MLLKHECLGQAYTVGWIAFRSVPWSIAGPFADFDDAATAAEALGSQFRIAYGERLLGTDDFVPMEEPVA